MIYLKTVISISAIFIFFCFNVVILIEGLDLEAIKTCSEKISELDDHRPEIKDEILLRLEYKLLDKLMWERKLFTETFEEGEYEYKLDKSLSLLLINMISLNKIKMRGVDELKRKLNVISNNRIINRMAQLQETQQIYLNNEDLNKINNLNFNKFDCFSTRLLINEFIEHLKDNNVLNDKSINFIRLNLILSKLAVDSSVAIGVSSQGGPLAGAIAGGITGLLTDFVESSFFNVIKREVDIKKFRRSVRIWLFQTFYTSLSLINENNKCPDVIKKMILQIGNMLSDKHDLEVDNIIDNCVNPEKFFKNNKYRRFKILFDLIADKFDYDEIYPQTNILSPIVEGIRADVRGIYSKMDSVGKNVS